MNAKNVYITLAVLIGFGMIIGGFIVFGGALPTNIRVLDIIVSCMVFFQVCELFFFPMVNMRSGAKKEVGMMGIHYTVIKIYTVLALAVLIAGIAADLSFKIQLFGQLFAFVLLLVGRFATLLSGEHVEAVYDSETAKTEAKVALRRHFEQIDNMAATTDLDAATMQRLSDLVEEMRYVTPSDDAEARALDARLHDSLDDIASLLRDTRANADVITREIDNIVRTLNRRKQY